MDKTDNALSKILIIDFGSQFTQLIARKIRELGVYSEILSHNNSNNINLENVKGIILSGGPLNVYQDKKIKFDNTILKKNIPILGICFGHQIISKEFGGKVKQSKFREFGLAEVTKIKKSLLLKNFFDKKNKSKVWMSHSDQVTKLPRGFKTVAYSKNSKLAIIENSSKKIYGVQFHPEVTHTTKGKHILKNFLFVICKINRNWSSKQQKKKLINDVRSMVGNKKVICALSGGVDSSVVAKLLHEAIGKKLSCIFVNTGLLRKNEEIEVVKTFKKRLKMNM